MVTCLNKKMLMNLNPHKVTFHCYTCTVLNNAIKTRLYSFVLLLSHIYIDNKCVLTVRYKKCTIATIFTNSFVV